MLTKESRIRGRTQSIESRADHCSGYSVGCGWVSSSYARLGHIRAKVPSKSGLSRETRNRGNTFLTSTNAQVVSAYECLTKGAAHRDQVYTYPNGSCDTRSLIPPCAVTDSPM